MINTKGKVDRNITKQDLTVRPYEVFYYLFNKFGNYDVSDNIKKLDVFKNPLRDDTFPSCQFYHNIENKLKLVDYSGWFHGDHLDLFMKLYKVSYDKALHLCYTIFVENKECNNIPIIEENDNTKNTVRERASIIFEKAEWNNNNYKYWKRYNVSINILNELRIYPVKNLFMRNKCVYSWRTSNPAYGYLTIPNTGIKIYRPYAKEGKFLMNYNYPEGYDSISYDKKYVIITKSLKDVAVLRTLGINSFALCSESSYLKKDMMDLLKVKFEYIFTLFDKDNAGITATKYHKKEYGTIPVFVPRNENVKDIADYMLYNGVEKTKQLIKYFIKYFKFKNHGTT